MYEKMRLDPRLDNVSNEELKRILLEKYEQRRTSTGRLYNNATTDNVQMTAEQFINTYLNEPYILSGYACFYKNQENSVNISSAALANLGDMRKFNKKKMEAAEHGSDEYIYYRVLQLTYKVLMNSYYGILGEKNSIFYNPFVQNSITLSGQDLITTAIIGMESFLSNNTKFEDTDDFITFVNNIKSTDFKYSILNYVDEPVSKEELLDYLKTHFITENYDLETVKSIVSKLGIELVNRVYYTNQFQKLLKNTYFLKKFSAILKYTYADTPAPETEEDLEELKSVVLDLCWYDWLFEERYKKAVKYKRQTVITIDTDLIGSAR